MSKVGTRGKFPRAERSAVFLVRHFSRKKGQLSHHRYMSWPADPALKTACAMYIVWKYVGGLN